jgi:hypothetical protein
MRTMPMWAAPVALMLVLGACDDSATAPSTDQATIEAAVRGDGGTSSDRASTGNVPDSTSDPADDASAKGLAGTASGSVQVTARVYVWSSASGWVEVTQGPQQATVDAAGSGGAALVGSARVAAGSYTRVRVEFDRVEAQLSGAVQLSTGLLDGAVTVDLGGDGKVTVERDVAVNASADAATELDVMLHSSAWLEQANAQAHTVAESAFAGAVTVSAR